MNLREIKGYAEVDLWFAQLKVRSIASSIRDSIRRVVEPAPIEESELSSWTKERLQEEYVNVVSQLAWIARLGILRKDFSTRLTRMRALGTRETLLREEIEKRNK